MASKKKRSKGSTEVSGRVSPSKIVSEIKRTAAVDRANRGASGTRGAAIIRGSQRGRQFDTQYQGAHGRTQNNREDNSTTAERGPNRGRSAPRLGSPTRRDAPFFLK